MAHVLRIAHLRIALHVANPEVGNREVHHNEVGDGANEEGCWCFGRSVLSSFGPNPLIPTKYGPAGHLKVRIH